MGLEQEGAARVADERVPQGYERQHDPARVLALSDGVFAIIITLLVLEIHVPDLAAGETLASAMQAIRPSIIAFLISFVVIAIAWAGHRDLFAHIRRTDRTLVWLNILFLLPLCLLPFGASLISRYDGQPVALRMYGILLMAISAVRLFIWLYATGRSHLLYEDMDRRSRRVGILAAVVPGLAYAVAYAIAKAAPTAALLIYAAVPVLYFVGMSAARTSALPGAADRDFT